MSKTERMQSALEAIAAMRNDETTDHAQLTALMQAIARITLEEGES